MMKENQIKTKITDANERPVDVKVRNREITKGDILIVLQNEDKVDNKIINIVEKCIDIFLENNLTHEEIGKIVWLIRKGIEKSIFRVSA